MAACQTAQGTLRCLLYLAVAVCRCCLCTLVRVALVSWLIVVVHHHDLRTWRPVLKLGLECWRVLRIVMRTVVRTARLRCGGAAQLMACLELGTHALDELTQVVVSGSAHGSAATVDACDGPPAFGGAAQAVHYIRSHLIDALEVVHDLAFKPQRLGMRGLHLVNAAPAVCEWLHDARVCESARCVHLARKERPAWIVHDGELVGGRLVLCECEVR